MCAWIQTYARQRVCISPHGFGVSVYRWRRKDGCGGIPTPKINSKSVIGGNPCLTTAGTICSLLSFSSAAAADGITAADATTKKAAIAPTCCCGTYCFRAAAAAATKTAAANKRKESEAKNLNYKCELPSAKLRRGSFFVLSFLKTLA